MRKRDRTSAIVLVQHWFGPAEVADRHPQQSARLQQLVDVSAMMVPSAPLPAAATSEDGVLDWRRGDRLLSFEIFADGTFEWFYVDHATHEVAGCDDPEAVLGVAILATYLALVITPQS